MKKIGIVLSTVAIMGFSSFFGTTVVDAANNIDDVKNERSELKKDLSDTEAKIADVLIDLKELNKEIERVEESLKQNEKMLDEANEEIEDTENEIEKLKEEIAEIEKSIERRYEILKDRVVSYQKSGGTITYLEVIFGSESFGDFISRVTTVNKITESDKNLIDSQEADKKLVKEKQDDLVDKLEESKQLKAELEEMQALIEDQKAQNEKKKDELKVKEQELQKKKEELKIKDSELAEIEESINNSSQLTTLSSGTSGFNSSSNSDSGQQKSSGSRGGLFAWPTDGGYISSGMGPRWGRSHNGTDIARTDRSTIPPIYSVLEGVVESASFNNGGYGNTVVIRHSNGMKTLYAHLSSISVSTGQKVSKGQKIGVMGSTGRSTGIHLHLEAYKNGTRVDPEDYL
ncbi:murein hydrolase activator EnvC family protein [Oceanobacillus salinisoli]|uniref:murein hydrolase activator EnvC family protein n=1 Tax=Oceanobacillus salinisoli TaxID=2678611 RepID=UPI0012E2CCF0|nr:peptidoglycan DD-metalloendopeptidase family protein [Oceanobacillus salinisoli]